MVLEGLGQPDISIHFLSRTRREKGRGKPDMGWGKGNGLPYGSKSVCTSRVRGLFFLLLNTVCPQPSISLSSQAGHEDAGMMIIFRHTFRLDHTFWDT